MKLTEYKKLNKTVRIMLAFISAAAVCLTVTAGAFAQTEASDQGSIDPPVKVNIPVSHKINGTIGEDEEYLFSLTAEDPSNPMPEGAERGSITIKVKGREKVEFGAISFDHPSVCYYKVSRADSRDDRAYRVMVTAYNDGRHELVAWESGVEGKAEEIVFEDNAGEKAAAPLKEASDKEVPEKKTAAKAAGKANSPKTGDELNLMEIAVTAAAGLIAMAGAAALIMIRRRETYDK